VRELDELDGQLAGSTYGYNYYCFQETKDAVDSTTSLQMHITLNMRKGGTAVGGSGASLRGIVQLARKVTSISLHGNCIALH